MKYKLEEKYGYPLVIRYEGIGFIEIYKTGVMYTDIQFNGNIKLLKKILKIASKELRKQKIRTCFNIS